MFWLMFTDIDNCKVTSSKQCDVADTPGGHFYHTIESDNNLYEGLKENVMVTFHFILKFFIYNNYNRIPDVIIIISDAGCNW